MQDHQTRVTVGDTACSVKWGIRYKIKVTNTHPDEIGEGASIFPILYCEAHWGVLSSCVSLDPTL